MPRLLQQLLAPLDPLTRDPREFAAQPAQDDDLALGFECATPALQFEAWDPAHLQQGPAGAY